MENQKIKQKNKTIIGEIFKIVLIIATIIIIGSILMTTLISEKIKDKVESTMVNQFIAEAQQVSNLATYVLENNQGTEGLQKLVEEEIKNDKNIAYAVIIDTSVTAVAHSDSEKVGKNYSDDTSYTVPAATKGEIKTSQFYADVQKAWTYDIMVPIYADGTLYGSMDLGIYNTELDSVENSLRTNIFMILFFVIVLVIIGLYVIIRKVRNVVKIVTTASDELNELANGNLNIQIDDKLLANKTEIGLVANSLVKVSDNLRSMIRNVAESSESLNTTNASFNTKFEEIAEGIKNLNIAVEELADASGSQAEAVMNVSESVSVMGEAVDTSVFGVESLEQSVENMTNVSSVMDGVLSELALINAKTSSNIEEVNNQTMETNASVQRIKSAVEMIKDIASQTNLLSLNASIEAARAGEAGKGFAVVADSIRQLSESSANSADEIENIVKELIHNSDASVQKMTEVSEDAKSEKAKLKESVKQFDVLKEEAASIDAVSQQILEQTKALKKVQSEIGENVSSLSALAEESSASLQESSASLHTLANSVLECKDEEAQLAELSNSLKEDTDKFKF